MTSDPFGPRFRMVRIPGWQLALIATGLAALLLALAIVATGVFLILFPILFVAGLAWRLIGGRRRPPPTSGPVTIDGDYEVLPPERRPPY